MRALVTGAFDPAGRLVIEQLLERGIEVVAADVGNDAEFPGVLALREIPAADDPLLVNVLRSLVEVPGDPAGADPRRGGGAGRSGDLGSGLTSLVEQAGHWSLVE